MTPPPVATDRAPAPLTLRGVTVVDVHDGSLRSDCDVAIVDGTITAVGPRDDACAPLAEVVSMQGAYVVPGYADMHAHPLGRQDPTGALALMLANGVTGFRQMHGSPDLLAQRRDGALDLPSASPALLAMPGALLTPFNAATADRAVDMVREQHSAGADFIKIAAVTPEVYFPAQAEANRLGIPMLGHLPAGIDVVAAVEAGFHGIEHLGPGVTMLAACSTDQTNIAAEIATAPTPKLPPVELPFVDRLMDRVLTKLVVNPLNRSKPADIELLQRAVDTFDEGKAAELADAFVAAGTWHVPTLIRLRTQQLCDACEFSHDPYLKYMAPATVQTWRGAAKKFGRFTAAQRETFRSVYDVLLRLTKILDTAGVKMLAGSDSVGAAWEVPGFSLHREFGELARAGLSPLRILQMTTSNAAEYLGTTTTAGSVAPGRVADLVLLRDDPLEDAAHLSSVMGVVQRGRLRTGAELTAIKNEVSTTSPAH
ncbi:amidohydrolase [Mycolicibacterium madagascariense]|uniref:Amidohydrolase n=1 Tax=Mycolicibacterium madagascariense TaxID=212765 RepID=A0A7I7XB88_9MYCO|nr:amidohydrolase family protein [Mycolicibacterium madagascariense]MCV7013580.1 amidohydrolase family protein [Mycolicibacterium madagascariense]BBZ27029.1 amidohydrolase [Mycolicibacterium madagascariense]